ncbi:MAG: carbohydrate binding domain-containing protein [Bacteroidaceae bacterium]|nr:carbohydrate binding domain-containing protein [Bacteroidaceae bacterium]MDO4995100.1 alpha-L-arabinofuranosidase C-terminal domain-containing protein [Bacteroidales bacterium]
MKHLTMVFAAFLLAAASATAQTHTFDINTKKLGAPIQKTMYGIFFEDINYAADGGLYGELVKNRSFEFTPDPLMGWQAFGKVVIKNDGPFDKNPHYARLLSAGHRDMWTGLQNEGFFGIGVEKDAEYRFTVYARVPDGKAQKLRVQLIEQSTMRENQEFTTNDIVVDSKDWKKYTVIIKSTRTASHANLRLFLCNDNGSSGNGTMDVEHVSLFPVDTWKGHENGMRKDLAQALADLHPGVFRFPGGCIVEGTTLDQRYQWKNSVGPVENRPINKNRWENTFTYRYFPDYHQSYGLGFYEYFLLSEEIGAEPLPVLSVGLACEFQNGSHRSDAHVPVDQLQPYIDDVLDLIEFANGDPAKNVWAKLRADMGHPAPFNLKFVAIGNEQWGEIYPENLEPFVKQVRAKYPNIKIIGTSGPNSEGGDFEYLWPEMKRLKADLVDEHFYRPESWFLKSGNRYDNYDRKGPKVFAGEYACHGRGKKWNHYNAALLEAAFLTGVERNADVVHMATYAPLFAHVDGWQWRPDMIWYDNLRSVRTCSWHVQSLYANNKGDNVLSLTMNKKPVAGNDDQDGLFASAVYEKATNTVIVKVVNVGDKAQEVTLNLQGMKGSHEATCTLFSASNLDGENTLDQPNAYLPTTQNVTVTAPAYTASVPAKSFAMWRIKK